MISTVWLDDESVVKDRILVELWIEFDEEASESSIWGNRSSPSEQRMTIAMLSCAVQCSVMYEEEDVM